MERELSVCFTMSTVTLDGADAAGDLDFFFFFLDEEDFRAGSRVFD